MMLDSTKESRIGEYKARGLDPVCRFCDEPTGGSPTSSMYGWVHRWGPTTHRFEPARLIPKNS